ncbi:hypothetical protein [Gottfriedia luciferensis]|uniref:hypothetical protein n=1 Tax=Gottfriedia luciferensis TaxID=178774 RepID=UPI001302AD98|nr:hypothetical protein [Gottfriedia luciferensis]
MFLSIFLFTIVIVSLSYGLTALFKRISSYYKRQEEQLDKIIELLQKKENY